MNTTATEIPEVELRATIVNVKIEDVKKGDTIATGAQRDINVGSVKVGTKWVELRSEAGTLLIRAEVGTEVCIVRQVETEESKVRRQRAMTNQAIRRSVEKRESGHATKKALAKINELVAKDYLVDSFQMGALIAGQAEDKVYDLLAVRMERVGKELEDGTILDEKAVYDMFVEEMKDRLVGSYDLTSGLSRSTSVVSNVMNDAEREAIVEFIRHGKWWF